MTSKLVWILRRIIRQIWFRVSVYGLAAILTALVASVLADFVPKEIANRVGDGTASSILSILASSMLVVATFSLGSMVQAYAAASQSVTPRATQILIDDSFSQNVISTFLGAFVFAMGGLIALSLDLYSRAGEFVLVVVSGLVITLVLTSLFGWLDHLANLVRLGETMAKVSSRAEAVLRTRAAAPRLGGVSPTAGSRDGTPVWPETTGYVRHVDPFRLQKIAAKAEGHIRINSMPGNLADPATPLLWASWAPDEGETAAMRSAFTLGLERSFDQDPRFCLQVLTEIASRALSPGINDPGTAIGVIAAQQRLLAIWCEVRIAGEKLPADCPRVMAPRLSTDDLFDDAFGPLLRDAAGMVEVGGRLQKTLASLAALGPADYARAAQSFSARAILHSDEALPVADDRERLQALSARVASTAGL